jgi:hypothetical protein
MPPPLHMGKYPLDLHKCYDGPLYGKFIETMGKVDFELNDVPEFHEEPITIEEAMRMAVWDIFFLALFSLLFFMASVAAFLRYDVR